MKGKKNGKGKEYEGDLIFEGEYLNGKRWNIKGKKYNSKGELIFEVEYLNGKKWNIKGKNFNSIKEINNLDEKSNVNDFIININNQTHLVDGKGLIFEYVGSNTLNNKFNDYNEIFEEYTILECSGFSIFGFPTLSIFEGEYLNGERNGKGKEYYFQSLSKKELILIYEGEYFNGKRNGKGKEYNLEGNIIFTGEYLNGKKWNGIGSLGTESIESELENVFGRKEFLIKDGKGLSFEIRFGWCCYAIFIGEYLNGERNGKCCGYILCDRDEIWFKGEYIKGELNGKVEIEMEKNDNRKKSEITFINNKANGKGKEFYENGNLKFEGEFLYNHKIRGKEYDKNGKLIYEGEYFDERNGKGKGYLDDKLIFKGEYLNGHRWKGIGKEYDYKGNLEFEGEYLDGKRWNGREIDYESKERKIINGEYEKKCIIF